MYKIRTLARRARSPQRHGQRHAARQARRTERRVAPRHRTPNKTTQARTLTSAPRCGGWAEVASHPKRASAPWTASLALKSLQGAQRLKAWRALPRRRALPLLTTARSDRAVLRACTRPACAMMTFVQAMDGGSWDKLRARAARGPSSENRAAPHLDVSETAVDGAPLPPARRPALPALVAAARRRAARRRAARRGHGRAGVFWRWLACQRPL